MSGSNIIGFNANFSLCVSAEPICTPMRICYAAVIFLVAVVAPLIVYFAVVSNRAESDDPVTGTCNIKIEYR